MRFPVGLVCPSKVSKSFGSEHFSIYASIYTEDILAELTK